MRWAVEKHGVRRFVTSVRPDNAASQRVVAKLGFRKVGQHLDEIDGVEDILHLDR